jgi:hypothetical protein
MSKPGLCKKHGAQDFVTASPRLKLAIEQGITLVKDDLCTLEILSGDTQSKNLYAMDSQALKSLGLNIVDNLVILRDRDKLTKISHHRQVIRKIFDAQRDNWVCSECLRQLKDYVTT